MRRNDGVSMDETVTLRLDEDGRYTLLSGVRELVHGLDASQAQRFAESLDGIMDDAGNADPEREPS